MHTGFRSDPLRRSGPGTCLVRHRTRDSTATHSAPNSYKTDEWRWTKKTIPGTATNTRHPDEIFKINVQRCNATKTKQTSSGDKMSSVKTVTVTSAVVFTLKYVASYTDDKLYTEINSLHFTHSKLYSCYRLQRHRHDH